MSIHQLKEIAHNFTDELRHADNDQQSSLPYIRHTLTESPIIQDNDLFQVLVIGGTVFRSAIAKKNKDTIEIISKSSEQPPKFKTKEDFLSYVSDQIDPRIAVLAVNFAYPVKPIFANSHLDGELLSGTKENEFEGMIGERVGNAIANKIYDARNQKITVSVANDTICLLLSGLSKYKKEELIGGIVGTGVNFAFFTESGEAVNLESANFDKFPLSAEAKAIDGMSSQPGRALFEKEVSGAYLFLHHNLHHPGHLISDTFALAELSKEEDISGHEAKKLLEHSASLVACQIAGILEYKERNLVSIMEGSLFWKAENYKALVETYISMLTKYTVKFIRLDDDSIIGGAMLVV